MEAPKVIWVSERPRQMKIGVCHVHKLSHADKYIHFDAPELVAAVEAMRGIVEAGQYASGRDMGEIAQDALAALESLIND